MIGNHLLQHRELSATAIGVAAHIQSLPDGAPVGIKALAERFPEGEIRLGTALRELERHGYLARRRERLEDGRVVTRTYSYNKPGSSSGGPPHTPSSPPAPEGEPVAEPVEEREQGQGQEQESEPTAAPVPAPEPEPAPVPVPESQPVPVPESQPERDPERDPEPEAVAVLAGLRRRDPRLLLSERDIARLAPAVSAWLERGVDPDGIERALSAGLPEPLRNAASVLDYRLRALLPPPLPPVRPLAAGAAGVAGDWRRPDPLQNCDGCDRAFRAPEPGRCRTCPPAEAAAAA
ncbi:helix-turn-helix domain-containing protein [Streptomyces sp. NPDC051546]|uniref:helix-turn-helix domain-containing protein n=1 Tax=Streptomyces sp. NPDC051546 TaxID=3365655 RepID=UPI0037BCBC21